MAKQTSNRMKPLVKILIGVVVAGILAVTAGPFIYINFIKDDSAKSAAEQGLPDRDPTASTTPVTATGPTPTVTSPATTAPTAPTATTATTASTATTAVAAAAGSGDSYILTPSENTFVGYRVVEVLFGQDTEGVGRTNSVTGSLTLDGTQITTAEFTVDVATFVSDENNRDRKFRGEIMDTNEFPTATFAITAPIELGTLPADGTEITALATGDLTLHGVTKSVTIEVRAQRTGDIIDVLGSTDIVFADYDIDNPSNGGITTQDHGLLEFVLAFVKA